MKARGVSDLPPDNLPGSNIFAENMVLDESSVFGKDLVGESSFAMADGAAEPISEPGQIASRLISDFAFELEQLGLWTWAVFVVLHDHCWRNREFLAKQIIQRHCRYDIYSDKHLTEFGWSLAGLQHLRPLLPSVFKKVPDFNEAAAVKEEKFLTEKLKVPSSWVFESKALYAHSIGDHLSEFLFLLQAGSMAQAHEVLCVRLLPRALCLHLFDIIGMLCASVDRSAVTNWHVGAGFYLDYIAVVRRPAGSESDEHALNVLKAARGFQLKLQRGDIDSRLNNLQFRQVLSQISAEMAAVVMKSSRMMGISNYTQQFRDLIGSVPESGTAQIVLTQKLAVGYFATRVI
jgi:hypothetical protein